MSYWEDLRHPKWQQMRLEVMRRDEFTCQSCGAADKTLNVHHAYYTRGKKPWEYPLETLRTLCEGCHKATEDRLAEVRQRVGMLGGVDMDIVIGYLRGAQWWMDGEPVKADSYAMALGVGMAFEVNDTDAWRAWDETAHVMDTEMLTRLSMVRKTEWSIAEAMDLIENPKPSRPA